MLKICQFYVCSKTTFELWLYNNNGSYLKKKNISIYLLYPTSKLVKKGLFGNQGHCVTVTNRVVVSVRIDTNTML